MRDDEALMLDDMTGSAIARWIQRMVNRVFVATFLPVLAVYLLTATYSRPWHIDAMTNAVTARSIGATGSPLLPDHVEAATEDQFGNVGWIVMSPRGPISQYPPGTALLAAPLYAVWGGSMTAVEMQGEQPAGPGSGDLSRCPHSLPRR